MNAIDSAALMKANKESLVETLQEIFPNEGIKYSTPMSELTKYMKWSGGLLDVCVAVIRKSDGERCYFDLQTWSDNNIMSSNVRRGYVIIGVRIRAEGQQFVIAGRDCSVGSTTTFRWWPTNGTAVKGLTNYNGLADLLGDKDGAQNTQLILQQATTSGITDNIAAKVASEYVACTPASDGISDNSGWYLPAVGQWILAFKYKSQINAVLTAASVGLTALTNDWYWTSTCYDSSNAWYVHLSNGTVYNYNKNYTGRVRSVSSC